MLWVLLKKLKVLFLQFTYTESKIRSVMTSIITAIFEAFTICLLVEYGSCMSVFSVD